MKTNLKRTATSRAKTLPQAPQTKFIAPEGSPIREHSKVCRNYISGFKYAVILILLVGIGG